MLLILPRPSFVPDLLELFSSANREDWFGKGEETGTREEHRDRGEGGK